MAKDGVPVSVVEGLGAVEEDQRFDTVSLGF